MKFVRVINAHKNADQICKKQARRRLEPIDYALHNIVAQEADHEDAARLYEIAPKRYSTRSNEITAAACCLPFWL